MSNNKDNKKILNEVFEKIVFFTSKKSSIGSLKEIFMAKYVSNKSEPL